MVQAEKKVQAERIRRPTHAPSIIGWHGIYLETPPDWNLAAVSGDMSGGHLRVDGPGGLQAQVRWQRVKGKGDVERNLDRYLARIQKTARRKDPALKIDRTVRLPIHRDNEKRRPLFFGWTGKTHAVGLIWHCPLCGRITVAQIAGPPQKKLTLLATQILGSLDDHAIDGCQTWAVYGLAAEIPADFALIKSQLLSGYLQLQFSRGNTKVQLERWGLADVTLKGISLQTWAQRRYYKLWQPYRTKLDVAEIRGHAGCEVEGELRGLRERARALAMGIARMKPAIQLRQYAWLCEDTNRICSVLVQHAKGEELLAEEIAASYVCHTT